MVELSSNLKQQAQQLAEVTSGMQQIYYQGIADNSKDIECVPLAEAFTPEELKDIKKYLHPQPKECYRNATKLCELFPDKVLYCEGLMDCFGFGIDHAWNKVGDKYVDITMEIALDRSDEIKDTSYLLYGEWDFWTINRVMVKTGCFGEVYRTLFVEKHKKEDK